MTDLEQHTHMNNFVRAYPQTKIVCSCIERGMGREDNEHDDSIEDQATSYLQSKNIHVDRNNIESCHIIKSQNQKAKM